MKHTHNHNHTRNPTKKDLRVAPSSSRFPATIGIGPSGVIPFSSISRCDPKGNTMTTFPPTITLLLSLVFHPDTHSFLSAISRCSSSSLSTTHRPSFCDSITSERAHPPSPRSKFVLGDFYNFLKDAICILFLWFRLFIFIFRGLF